MGPTPRSLEERFWPKVERTAGCWHWLGATARGYGMLWDREVQRARAAHRIAYELLVGPIPEGLTIDHLCRNRACVNPAHLEPVPNRENVQRGARGRLVTHCPRGHPYDEANTYIGPNGGGRQCRTCRHHRARLR